MFTIKRNTLSAEEFYHIFQAVGWTPPSIDQVAKALENTICSFAVYDDGKVIAMSRLLGDTAMSFYIKDFAVLPEYQAKGVGRILMEQIQLYIRERLPKDWKVSLELISTHGKEGFYSKFGFGIRPNENDGAGMFMMIEP